nr:AAA family ATPase [Actinomycetota bacterium]
MARVEGEGLLERCAELDRVAFAVDEACAGSGGLVVVEGEAGIGKTALLGAARALAERAGLVVYAARGAELEGGFGFGVVRQLFE